MQKVDLNVTEMACPMPLIRVKKAVKEMQRGELLRITGNDPIFEETMQDFCEENAHEILERQQDGRVVTLLIKI